MADQNLEKYILTDVDPDYLSRLKIPKSVEDQRKAGNLLETSYMFHLDDTILPGGFYTDCHWVISVKGSGGAQTESAHTHAFGETLGFVGSDPFHPRELGGEIELWLEDKKFSITQSCLIFVPANMKHLPLIFKRVDRPFFFWTASDSKTYGRTSGQEI